MPQSELPTDLLHDAMPDRGARERDAVTLFPAGDIRYGWGAPMSDAPLRFDPDSVRESWNHAARAYSAGQASGRDYYRYAFFGPAQIAMCGDVRGLRLLDVGCGSGYFAREMAKLGAQVTAIDLSPRMIEHARSHETASPLAIAYHVADAAELETFCPAESFDMATSCVALQDMPSVTRVLRAVHQLLRPGGRFVASITHPCSNPPVRRWERDESGRKRWLCVDHYFDRGIVEYHWLGWEYDFITTARHAPLEDWFEWILGAGFTLRALREPRPSAEALRQHPDLEDAGRIAYYVMFDLRREV